MTTASTVSDLPGNRSTSATTGPILKMYKPTSIGSQTSNLLHKRGRSSSRPLLVSLIFETIPPTTLHKRESPDEKAVVERGTRAAHIRFPLLFRACPATARLGPRLPRPAQRSGGTTRLRPQPTIRYFHRGRSFPRSSLVYAYSGVLRGCSPNPSLQLYSVGASGITRGMRRNGQDRHGTRSS
jgi:hypothetical protein